MSTQFERTGNPFPGLRPFDTDEYNLFFGRDGQSDELLARLARTRFLAVVGTSGSGKSSLIRAGLTPALYGGLMAQTGSAWRIAVLRPGSNPIGNLACALSRDDVIGSPETDDDVQAAIIETTLRRSTLGLVDAVRQARLASYENVLVVVDQFEELFRFRSMREVVGSEDDAAAFVKLLLEAPRERDANIYVVLTMRSDFLGDCAQFWGLPEAINEGQYLIPRMTRDERRSAITGPALVADAEISAPLVNRLLNDAGDNPDQLPILQHALMRTWDYWAAHRRDGQPVGLEDYEAVGTMSDALSRHAEEAYAELPDERSRVVAACMFKALTERGADNRETRRPTRLADICAIAEASEDEVRWVVEVFRREGRSFLMPPAGTPLDAETVIDISHESLIRNWQRLKDWARDEAEAARIYRRLAGAALDYRAGEVGLLDDVTLQWVLKWKETYKPNRAWGLRYHEGYDEALGYLEESRAAREREAEERERQRQELLERERREREQAEAFAEEQRRAAQRLRRFTVALVAISLFALLAAFASAFAFRRARSNLALAQQNEARAEALAGDLKNSLAGERSAKEDAQRQRSEAEDARLKAVGEEKKAQDEQKRAEAEKKRAEDEKKRADEAASRAEHQAKVALDAKAQAEKAQAAALAAQKAAVQKAHALEANGLFRDATIFAERGEYDKATKMYNDAINGLQTNGVKDTEGVADTYVQLGQTHFAAVPTTSLNDDDTYGSVEDAVKSYNRAVAKYEEAAVGAEAAGDAKGAGDLRAKAADTLISVGATLLNVANGRFVGRNVSRTSTELAALSVSPKPYAPSAVFAFDEEHDPKVEIKNEALGRYKAAFLLYRRAGNEDGMMRAAYRIGNFYLRDELPAWQDKTPTLDIARCNDNRQEFIGNRQKALCYFRELERLFLASGKSDADIQRLLVVIGGIDNEQGDEASAEGYFNRARDAYMKQRGAVGAKPSDGDAWLDSAAVSENAGLDRAAFELYGRARLSYEKAGDFFGQSQAYFEMGSIKQKTGKDEPGAAATILSLFRDAVGAYGQSMKAGDFKFGYDRLDALFVIGSFAYDNYDEKLALDAYNVALELGQARRDELMQARAWNGIASVKSQNDAVAARQSYMRSFALYTSLRDDALKNNDVPRGDEFLKELERIAAAVTSLDREIKAKASAGHGAQDAGSLCPFPVIAYAQPNATDGDAVTFSAYAVYPDESKLTYEWTLNSTAAKIISTERKPYPVIHVSTNGVGKADLTATLVVTGGTGAGACRQTASATTKVAARPPIPVK
jgi:energy-coupling factor transporter ATP-binding protein EcfA2/chemotaxis protein histidine kinase CheA